MTLDRTKQTAVLNRTQEKRKQQKQQKVMEAVRRLEQEGKPITFGAIAQIADVSISYLYKWPQIKDYIQCIRDQQEHQFQSLAQEREPGPHSLKTLHEVSRKRIGELEAQLKELKRQNEVYRGHVAEIYELRDEVERLRTQLRELMSPQLSNKVVPLKAVPSPPGVVSSEIAQRIELLGIKLGVRLQKEIKQHTPEKVMQAIVAFEQYRSTTAIENPGACLLTMIKEDAEPNVPQKPTTPQQQEFDQWYAEAIKRGFCLDISKNHLSLKGNEPLVKVVAPHSPSGYIPMPWKEAREVTLWNL